MKQLVVTCLRGARQGTQLEFDKTPVTFGRRDDNDVHFPAEDASVSGRHAIVTWEDGRWLVRDAGSLNGTWIDGERVESPRPVGEQTVIELGNDGPRLRLEVPGAGARTIEQTKMVPAMGDAVLGGRSGKRRSTAFYQLMIEDTVKRSSRRLKRIIAALTVGFVIAVVVLWIVLARVSDESAASNAAVRAAESIVTRFGRSVFMLIAQRPSGELGFCTAFAISADGVLATNAHCVRELKDLRSGGASGVRIVARMNTPEGSAPTTFDVRSWKEHPDYDGTDLSPDVAVVALDLGGATLPVVAELASEDVALGLKAGQPIFTLGFPGQVMNEARPAADLRAAVVSRLTTRDNTPGDAASSYVVWHSALTSKGTSGSPIFDADGRVVAVNNGGLSAREVLVTDPATGKARREVISEATGLNYGIRVDRLLALISR